MKKPRPQILAPEAPPIAPDANREARSTMTAERLQGLLLAIDMTQRRLADHTGYSPGAVRNWVTGKAAIPQDIAAWLERAAKRWTADPPPRREASTA